MGLAHARPNYFDHVEFLLDTSAGQGCPHSGTNNTTYAYSGPTIQGPQPSGTWDHAPEIRYRIGNSGSVEAYAIIIGIIIIKMWGNLGHSLIDPVATVVAISNLVYRL